MNSLNENEFPRRLQARVAGSPSGIFAGHAIDYPEKMNEKRPSCELLSLDQAERRLELVYEPYNYL